MEEFVARLAKVAEFIEGIVADKEALKEAEARVAELEEAINSRKRKILCHQNNKKYNSIIEAAKDLNLNTGKICEVCKGTRNHTKGYTFEYIKED